jgi:hypothetical protein
MDNLDFTLTMFEFALIMWALATTGLCFYLNDKLNTFKYMTMAMVEHIADGNAKFVRNTDGSVDVIIKKDK